MNDQMIHAEAISVIAEKQDEIKRLKAMVVTRFDHDTPPSFEQGYREH